MAIHSPSLSSLQPSFSIVFIINIFEFIEGHSERKENKRSKNEIPHHEHAAEISSARPAPEGNSLLVDEGLAAQPLNALDLIFHGVLGDVAIRVVLKRSPATSSAAMSIRVRVRTNVAV